VDGLGDKFLASGPVTKSPTNLFLAGTIQLGERAEASPRRLGMAATPSSPDPAARTSRCGRKRDVGVALTRWRRGVATTFAATQLNRSAAWSASLCRRLHLPDLAMRVPIGPPG